MLSYVTYRYIARLSEFRTYSLLSIVFFLLLIVIVVIILFTCAYADVNLTMASRETSEPHADGVEAFVRGMTSEVNAADVSRMMMLQQHMYVT